MASVTETQINRFVVVARYVFIVSIASHGIIAIIGGILSETPVLLYFLGATLLYTGLAFIIRPQTIALTVVLAIAEVCTVVWFLLSSYDAGLGVVSLLFFLMSVVFFVPTAMWKRSLGWVALTLYTGFLLFHFEIITELNIRSFIEAGGVFVTAVFIAVLAQYYNQIAANAEAQLELEHEKSERLLHNAMPAAIVKRLKDEQVIADRIESASVLFADIVGFTKLAAKSTPEEVVASLDKLFRSFDGEVTKLGLEKIKTIGDAYMVAAGVPEAVSDHAEKTVRLAGLMFAAVERFNAYAKGPLLNLRIGINSGPVLAGVIGEQRFAYDLWGDTVNVASRMETTGAPGRVHITDATKLLLGADYHFEERPSVDIKGKGVMRTWFVQNRV